MEIYLIFTTPSFVLDPPHFDGFMDKNLHGNRNLVRGLLEENRGRAEKIVKMSHRLTQGVRVLEIPLKKTWNLLQL